MKYRMAFNGNKVSINDDYTVFNYYVTEDIINSKNRDKTVNAAIREILFAQFFYNSGELLHLTTTVYDLSNNILGTVEWPETTGYFSN